MNRQAQGRPWTACLYFSSSVKGGWVKDEEPPSTTCGSLSFWPPGAQPSLLFSKHLAVNEFGSSDDKSAKRAANGISCHYGS